VRLPWQRRVQPAVDPNHRHEYRSKGAGGLGESAVVFGGGIAGPGAVARSRGCGVPGCGKPRDHLIHAPAEE
jgi:hypothetical protein